MIIYVYIFCDTDILFLIAGGANRLDPNSDEEAVFNDNASIISNVSSGSLMKDEGKFAHFYIFN